MHSPLRIAVLECDTPLDSINRRYNGYGGVFRALLTASAKALNQPEKLNPETGLEITAWDIVNDDKYPKLEDVDAVLLTGSKHNSFDDIPWINRLVEFTQQVLAQDRVRLLGICFGHQIVGRALGAKVGRSDQGWEIAVCDMDLTDKGKELFGREKIRIQQMHRDIVFEYPPNVTPLGSSPRCAVQGMYSPRRFVTVQGHPEFTGDMVTEIIGSRTKSGIFKETQGKDALSRAHNEHDGVAIGAVFLKFLLED
ncbi:hypothetical protein N7499_005965 [Penicillium canescens]|uniref:uncharacterized protein n=1 Tax=Penicillium canescens TaxID=5083 RepID=UPI0026DF9C5B|nr:uncharacterized protein N7446_001738 [Penicillium canescens]KAJ5997640.1 hypothetical protein N7522_009300 [Penicillium canescens]KAJ6073961.1 hypothetical protein N7446_001738 [Penicillium canescens]KAJ6081091.1 hypothetical protein N7499_005965 [Penicillium canescens]KAJ6177112.1 hypothetical protein N7485_004026 [Penicillium canescens]